jgi:hypothetical protein
VGLSDLFSRQPKRFVSKAAFETNLETQMAMTPQTLQQLRKYNVAPENRRQLEFSVYTVGGEGDCSRCGGEGQEL